MSATDYRPATQARPAGDTAPAPVVPDRGRWLAAVVFGVLAATSVVRLVRITSSGGMGIAAAASLLGAALVLAFNVLTVSALLRRPRASARSGSRPAHVAAIVATGCSISTAFLVQPRTAGLLPVAADVLQLAGLAFAVWSLRTLGRSFSILAEARAVVDRGPYRWVRHPLYVAEVLASAGLALHGATPAAVLSVVVLAVLQVYRAGKEEAVLAGALPGYAAYQARTARLVPGLF